MNKESDEQGDHHRDSVVNISMGEEEVKLPAKYPEFNDLSLVDKVDILATEIVLNGEELPIEVLLPRLGITHEQYFELTASDEYTKLVNKKCLELILAPAMPGIYTRLSDGAKDGNDSKISLALKAFSVFAPEIAVQNNYMQMTDDELVKTLEQLQDKLKGE